jgi:uncharacterized protein YqgC (DUF456 family)
MSILTIILIIIAIIAALLGIAGTVLPSLPGPPLCFVSMVVVYFACPGQITLYLLLLMLLVTIIVVIMDYTIPIVFTKMGGGSKPAMWGTTIGTFAGLFFLPWGLVLGPLLGAFIGEIIKNRKLLHASKVSMMSFVSFLLSTVVKLVASLLMTFFTIHAVWNFVN